MAFDLGEEGFDGHERMAIVGKRRSPLRWWAIIASWRVMLPILSCLFRRHPSPAQYALVGVHLDVKSDRHLETVADTRGQ